MKFRAIALTAALGFVGSISALAFQDDAATPAVSPAVEEAVEAVAEEASAAAEMLLDGAEVEAAIAAFNEGNDTPRTFTAEERKWIGMGLPAEEVELVVKGYAAIPSGDPNVVLFMRDGEVGEIKSNPDKETVPVAQHLPPFAEEIDEGTFWMAKAGSQTAKDVDAMFDFIMWINYIFTAIIGVLMVWFCFKYRRREGVRADQSITHNTPIEIIWSVLPTILCAVMFWGGYVTFLDLRTPPPDSMQITAGAYRWGWDFTYENGVQSPKEFHVPENTPIEMVMTSSDVLHSFHLPAFRAKSDVLPNRYTKIWFDSGSPGTYRVYCSEYCGKNHSDMYAKLVVEPREDYEAWLTKAGNWMVNENGELKSPLEIGKLTYTRRACNVCHSIDGKKGTGPTFAGLWGLERKFDDGTTRIADENYVRQSILDPHSQLIEGYGKQMTIYSPALPIEQIDGIIAFLKDLKDVPRKD